MKKEFEGDYEIPEEQFLDIQNQIIERFTTGRTSVNQPSAFIIGGQPGAGKTALEKIALKEVNGNAVVCNVDNLRDFHPMATEIKKIYPLDFGYLTQNAVHRWNDALLDYVKKNRLNYVMETTFNSAEKLDHSVRSAKNAGYKIHISLLAIHPKLSMLGCYMRYENALKYFGAGRMVPKEAHDIRFMSLEGTILKIQQQQEYDTIKVYARDFQPKTQFTNEVKLLALNPDNPHAVWKREVNKPWTNEMVLQWSKACFRVIELINERGGNQQEIQRFLDDVSDKNLHRGYFKGIAR